MKNNLQTVNKNNAEIFEDWEDTEDLEEKDILKFEEYQLMRSNIDRKRGNIAFLEQRDRLFLDLLWETGARVSDVINIHVKNIKLNNLPPYVHLWVEKSDKFLDLYLTPEMVDDLKNYIKGYKLKDSDELFKFEYRNAYKLISELGERAVGRHVHPHMFRHGNAMYLLETFGLSMDTLSLIKERLGHKELALTIKWYAKIRPRIQEQKFTGFSFRRRNNGQS